MMSDKNPGRSRGSAKERIDSFSGKYRFLSNFYPSPVETSLGFVAPTVEHAYQAEKSNGIRVVHIQIISMETPGQAKQAGQNCLLPDDWDKRKLGVMEGLLRQKFKPNSLLGDKLLATGDAELIEGNTWGDTYWGVCRGKGENHLGKLLMKIRDDLRKQIDCK